MTDYLKSVRRGEPIEMSAAAWNKLMDMARRDGERGASGTADPLLARRDRDVVLVKNVSGIDYPRWGALGLGAPVYLPRHNPPSGKQELPQDFAENLVLKGEMPIAGVHEGLFGVLLQPLKVGEIGPAVVSGTFGCVIVVQDERHRFADVYPSRPDAPTGASISGGTPLVDGDVHLRSCDHGGAEIIWKEAGLGERYAALRLAQQHRTRFRAILGLAHLLPGERFRWRYEWQEARIDADPNSETYGSYVPLDRGLSSRNKAGAQAEARMAINRYESHLSQVHPQPDDGVEGFANAGACIVPGVPESCPPEKAAVPILQPILEGVCVELVAEPDSFGNTRYAFEALNGVVFTEMEVPPQGGAVE
ncbi:hypothetical protein [Phenylobacterium sp.]|jgi:hypothetical protein|uniref:hypothetical protein n=1 Tax=Phenylobacterium sp. TaxID=1871053 RepID=UPI0037CA0424